MSSRLRETYQNEIVDGMMKKFGYKNELQVPKLAKIVGKGKLQGAGFSNV